MTVEELVKELSAMPQDAEVTTIDDEVITDVSQDGDVVVLGL